MPVRVLEARDRIGGRIETVREQGVTLDLGASWIHGYVGNPLTALAREAAAPTVATSYSSSALHVAPSLAASGLGAPDTDRWSALVRAASRHSRSRESDEPLSVALHREQPPAALSATERADLAFHLNATFATEWGADPHDLSSSYVNDGKEFGTYGEDLLFPDGYDQVVDHLARDLPIDTGVIVEEIDWSSDPVVLRTSAGSVRASAVVVTVPVELLRQRRDRVHARPPGSGGRGDRRDPHGRAQQDLPAVPRAVLADRRRLARVPRAGAWPVVAVAQPVPSGCPGAGRVPRRRRGPALEAADPRVAPGRSHAHAACHVRCSIPEPTSCRTTEWSQDPFARGSYSYPGRRRQSRRA